MIRKLRSWCLVVPDGSEALISRHATCCPWYLFLAEDGFVLVVRIGLCCIRALVSGEVFDAGVSSDSSSFVLKIARMGLASEEHTACAVLRGPGSQTCAFVSL